MQQLLVSRLASCSYQSVDRAVYQTICRPIGAELVVANVKTRAIGCVFTDVLGEQNPPAQAPQVVLHGMVLACKATLCEHDEVVQEQMDEHLQHIESPHSLNLGLVEYSLRSESTPRSKHGIKNPFGFGFIFVVFDEIHLWQDFQDCFLSGFDDSDVVSGKQLAVPGLDRRPVIIQVIAPIDEGEFLQVFEFVRGQPDSLCGQIVMFSDYLCVGHVQAPSSLASASLCLFFS